MTRSHDGDPGACEAINCNISCRNESSKEPHGKTRERYTVVTPVTFPKGAEDGKTLSLLFKGEGSIISKDLDRKSGARASYTQEVFPPEGNGTNSSPAHLSVTQAASCE